MFTRTHNLGSRLTRSGLSGLAMVGLLAGLLAQTSSAQSTINSSNRFAYGANIGWADARADGLNGAVIGEYVCSGYLYAANVGWIKLGGGFPANGIQYQNNSAADFGVNLDATGKLRGYAWGANIGWVNFETLGDPKLNLWSGVLSGYIYGANVGWISLSNAVAYVQTDTLRPGLDSDGDGIPDAYELTWTGNLTTMNATSDQDGDGVSDLNEYLAGTNPMDPTDYLRITNFVSNNDNSFYSLTWTSTSLRHYKIQKRADLNPLTPWIDLTLGLIYPDPGTTTSRSASDSPATQRFFRVQAIRPLLP
ncbi:MAG: hypothetical protein JWR69_1558 [Pedosphaera sp.]|nr:hypothetical protein [Pedosphaera sp.]